MGDDASPARSISKKHYYKRCGWPGLLSVEAHTPISCQTCWTCG